MMIVPGFDIIWTWGLMYMNVDSRTFPKSICTPESKSIRGWGGHDKLLLFLNPNVTDANATPFPSSPSFLSNKIEHTFQARKKDTWLFNWCAQAWVIRPKIWLCVGVDVSLVLMSTSKIDLFVCMFWQKYFGCHVGFWFQCRPSSWCQSNELNLYWGTSLRNPHELLSFAYGFASMSGDPTERCWKSSFDLSFWLVGSLADTMGGDSFF
jgi:hypothetical protein